MFEPDMETMTPARRAATIAGISPQRLWYWESTGLISPSVRRPISKKNVVRLYSFERLVELVVAAALVDAPGISLQHLRKIITYLQEDAQYENPLRELRFAVRGDQVYFQHPDGSWEGSRNRRQLVVHQVLDLAEIRSHIRSRLRRDRSTFGHVEKRRSAYGSKPVFAGTRVPIAAVKSFIEGGASDQEILEAYPDLDLEDVRAVRDSRLVAS